MSWAVVVEPVGENPGLLDKAKAAVGANVENTGGMVIYIEQGTEKREVSRVAFVRRASRNPSVSFNDQLQAELAKAKTATDTLNGAFQAAGELS